MLATQEQWSKKFAEKGLLLAPGIAQMHTTGEIAAQICLEKPALDTLDILALWKGFPTYASTQPIFTILKADWFHLENNKLVKWDPLSKIEVMVPGQHETALALPWGGTSHPIWFKNDPRVATCRAVGGVFDRKVMEGVAATVKMVELQQPPKRAGFASACQAFGHHELLGILRSFGLVLEPILTTHG